MQLVFDLETNGLLPKVSTLHVCCTYDLDTKEEWHSTDPQEILDLLDKATHLIGHNVLDFDLAVLAKLFNWKPKDEVQITDTVILSRLGYRDRPLPSNMGSGPKITPHSLGAWGYRVGVGKPEHEDWTRYSKAMLHRCREDVRINAMVYTTLEQEVRDFGESVAIEHEVQRIISKQERDGVFFDTDRALRYVRELGSRVESIDERLQSLLPRHARQVGVSVRKPFKKDGSLSKMSRDWCESTNCQPVVDLIDKQTGDCLYSRLVAGPFTRIEWYQTDLNSDKQVKEWLLSIGWKPKVWNTSVKTGERTSPKLTPDSFKSLPENVGEALKERVTWRHRRSQIQGWIDRVRADHCLPAGANTLGTNTGRMRHRTVVNVPKAADFVPFGKEMRSLFRARPNRVIVGHDASGLELRMLAHYMNDKEFTEQVLHGDIHSYNQRLAGLPTRDSAKTFIYAFT